MVKSIQAWESREGLITSPLFPDPYPKCVNATYFFRGGPGQKVVLEFKLLEIGDPNRYVNTVQQNIIHFECLKERHKYSESF